MHQGNTDAKNVRVQGVRSPAGPSRRRILIGGGVLAAGALTGAGQAVADDLTPESGEDASADRKLTVSEGTNIAAALSPDRATLAVDVLSAIWVLPSAGGNALRLTDELQDATQPHWSPDGSVIAFQSFRDGAYQLWTVGRDGQGLRQLTKGDYDNREPQFSPDGKRIAFSSDQSGSNDLWLLDVATGVQTRVTSGDSEEGTPAWSSDGKRIVCTVDDSAIDVVDVATGERTRLVGPTPGAKVFGPALSPDGTRVSYVRILGTRADVMVDDQVVASGEDVHALRTSWVSAGELLYTAAGGIRRLRLNDVPQKVPFTATVSIARPSWRRTVRDFTAPGAQPVKGIAGPVVSPDGRQVAFRALNALWVMRIGQAPTRITDDGYFNSDPDWSPDSSSLVYASDRSGTAALWRQDVKGGAPVRLTNLSGAQLTPRWSPDGTKIAYQDENGGTWVLELGSGAVRQVLPAVFQPGRPSWAPDGKRIVLAANKPYSKRNRAGLSEILSVDLETGTTRSEPVAAHRSIATRGDDGPVWTPDGKYFVCVMESTAWRVPVDATGRITAGPERITTEVTDSVSVDGSGTLFYLSNGRLRKVAVSGGTPQSVPLDLSFRRPVAAGTTVFRAGALWDGRSSSLRRQVDVVVKAGRVAEILPAGQGRGDKVVDASGLTLMPGLIDAHLHWHIRGRQWGDRTGRLLLSYGITTVISPGDPAYQMVETREALESGAKAGPRFFGTGDALDGARVFWNFARPVVSAPQLQLEMERARALSYDLIKTYIRLPAPLEAAATKQAHLRGMPVTSHYAYPQATYGMDSMEHTGGGNRVGYSQTQTRLGRAYEDAIGVLTTAGMPVTSTLMNSSVLLADDRSLVDDERTKCFYPAWDYGALVAKADAAGGPTAELNRALLAGGVDMLLRVQRGGGTVVAGSDAPLDDPAISLHQNLRAMVRGGFTPYEALRTATANPAQRMGLGTQLGTVSVGALADFVCVEGDPLSDINAAARVRSVVVGGVARTVATLMEPFTSTAAGAAAAAPTNRTARSLVSAEAQDTHGWHDPRPNATGCLC
ncbi:amidohydrolase family protein [Streptomyces sp. NPDC059835]|uniref:amidohydrolase family protein n=1 Tax=Streptomyces sp. NPDC059835 TaxID=3346967 RepID=UPI003668A673